MIDAENAWMLIRQNALKAVKVNLIWHSLVDEKEYQLLSVGNDRLEIIRESGGDNQPLTKARVIKAGNDFNNAGCRVRRRHLISTTVAEETAFVLFHPDLTWDENNEFIIKLK